MLLGFCLFTKFKHFRNSSGLIKCFRMNNFSLLCQYQRVDFLRLTYRAKSNAIVYIIPVQNLNQMLVSMTRSEFFEKYSNKLLTMIFDDNYLLLFYASNHFSIASGRRVRVSMWMVTLIEDNLD